MECESDPVVAVNPFCHLKPVSRDVKRINMGVSLLKPASKVYVRLYNMKKTYTNHYMPGVADVTQNYCEMANQTTTAAVFFFNAIKRFSPTLHEMFQQNIHYCPLRAGLITVNATYVSDVTDQPLIPPGEYKFVFQFFDENNKTLYHGRLYTVRQDKSRRSYRN
jgi:Protein of unknown function (DUF1091)